ncbi:MAG: MFS transporter [Planctomycetota bacterium]|nr:MFS transporter [Planctomycetota bacterium]MDA1249798.1 MFS transporter [Planctomycetota bacterium]
MNTKRKLLFACLYLSEGAPIGFLWLAMPTRLRASGVPIEQITWLTAVLVLPWTFKFAWAPLIDLLQGPRWSLRSWIVTAQSLMGLTLLSLLVFNPVSEFEILAMFLIMHAFAAATQDVAIDALCISVTDPTERGEINGWMQTGMLLGRAMLGGGALVIAPFVGDAGVVGLLIGVTTFSMILVLMMKPEAKVQLKLEGEPAVSRRQAVGRSVRQALKERNTWVGLAFALTGGAAFKALEVIYGPFLIDRGFTEAEVGSFAALPMIGLMVAGSLAGGFLSDRFGRRRFVAVSLVLICLAVSALAGVDYAFDQKGNSGLLVCLSFAAFGIGLFTAASYAMFMDITHPAVAATQFSAFMGLTNGCESWSTWTAGLMISEHGYSVALLVLCGASMLSLSLLPFLKTKRHQSANVDAS